VGRSAPRPDTTNASGVRTPVPAGAWRGSSAHRGHTARTSCRAPLQTCIPTPRTERHTPVSRGVCAVSHLQSPHSTGPGRPRQSAPRTGGGLDTQLRPRSGTRALISVASPRNRGFSGVECEPLCASRFQARTRIRVRRPGHALWGMLLGSTLGSASGPELADHGGRPIGAIDETYMCRAREYRDMGFECRRRRPAAGTSLRRARGERCLNLRR
jgi:hypothetical protein